MERNEILQMAREQGLPETETKGVFIVNTDDLGRMLAAEREVCSEIADQCADADMHASMVANAIRARK